VRRRERSKRPGRLWRGWSDTADAEPPPVIEALRRAALLEELPVPRYEQMSDGRLRLESKKSMRGRLGKSPDHGDALALDLAGRRPMSVPGVILL
jgi:hypothetical protein